MAKILPKELVRSNISMTTHPVGIAKMIEHQFDYAEKQKKFDAPKNVVILGGSAGYGLATRVTLSAAGSHTISASLDRFPTERRPLADPSFWGQNEFIKIAKKKGIKADNLFFNAFEDSAKEETIKAIKEKFENGKVDLLVYSIASPKRQDPKTGILHSSSLKTLKGTYSGDTIDVAKGKMKTIKVTQANQDEIDNTVKVMGGEDWELWMEAFNKAGVLSDSFKTVAYTYLGSPMTDPIYRNGTIGKAKEHLEATAKSMTSKFNVPCSIVSLKAVITAASVFIPTFPIYASALIKVMKEKGTNEGTIEQIYRFYSDMYYGDNPVIDKDGFYRPDNLEMDKDVQAEVERIMSDVNPENFMELVNGEVFIDTFHNTNGFRIDGVDYSKEIDTEELYDPSTVEVMKNHK